MKNLKNKEVFVTYHHSGKEFKKDMSHIIHVKDKFRFACMMILDNNAEGYIKDINGKIYTIVAFKLTIQDLKAVETFRKQLVKKYIKTISK